MRAWVFRSWAGFYRWVRYRQKVFYIRLRQTSSASRDALVKCVWFRPLFAIMKLLFVFTGLGNVFYTSSHLFS